MRGGAAFERAFQVLYSYIRKNKVNVKPLVIIFSTLHEHASPVFVLLDMSSSWYALCILRIC